MIIRKAYKFRMKPDQKQLAKLQSFSGHCRFVWNKVLALNLKRLEENKLLIWYHEADFWTKLWKQSDEYQFLKEVPAHCIQQKLKDLNRKYSYDTLSPCYFFVHTLSQIACAQSCLITRWILPNSNSVLKPIIQASHGFCRCILLEYHKPAF